MAFRYIHNPHKALLTVELTVSLRVRNMMQLKELIFGSLDVMKNSWRVDSVNTPLLCLSWLNVDPCVHAQNIIYSLLAAERAAHTIQMWWYGKWECWSEWMRWRRASNWFIRFPRHQTAYADFCFLPLHFLPLNVLWFWMRVMFVPHTTTPVLIPSCVKHANMCHSKK